MGTVSQLLDDVYAVLTTVSGTVGNHVLVLVVFWQSSMSEPKQRGKKSVQIFGV